MATMKSNSEDMGDQYCKGEGGRDNRGGNYVAAANHILTTAVTILWAIHGSVSTGV